MPKDGSMESTLVISVEIIRSIGSPIHNHASPRAPLLLGPCSQTIIEIMANKIGDSAIKAAKRCVGCPFPIVVSNVSMAGIPPKGTTKGSSVMIAPPVTETRASKELLYSDRSRRPIAISNAPGNPIVIGYAMVAPAVGLKGRAKEVGPIWE